MLRGAHSSAPRKRHSSTAAGASGAIASAASNSSSGRNQRACDGAYLECVDRTSMRFPRASNWATVWFNVGWSACTTTSTSRPSSTRYRPSYMGPPTNATRSGMRPSHAPAAVDQVDRAGGVGGLIRGQIDDQRGDLFRSAQAAHRLAGDEAAPALDRIAEARDALIERRRLHGA